VLVFTEPSGSNFLHNISNSLLGCAVSQTRKKCTCLNHCDFLMMLLCDGAHSPLGALRKQSPATDQEKEKLNLCVDSDRQSANVLTDINFQVAKVSLIM
jgi:hypothetical protein